MATNQIDYINYKVDEKITITDIYWERVFLVITIKSDYDEPATFRLSRFAFDRSNINYDGSYTGNSTDIPASITEEVPLEPISCENGTYIFRINTTIVYKNTFLPNGRWYLSARVANQDAIILCRASYELAYKLSNLDKIFYYGSYRYSYNGSFVARCFDDINIIPVYYSRFMIENLNWDKLYVVHERRTLRGKYLCILKIIKTQILQTIYNTLDKLYPKKGHNILLMSETKPYLWGNLKYINQRLEERGLDKEFNITKTFRIAVGKNNSARSWFHTIRKLAMQDYVFVDDYVPIFGFLKLSKKTKLIQVWHAGEGFKSVGYARFGKSGSPRPAGNCHRAYDYAITASKRLSEVYSEVFGLPEERILPLGMARLDGFLDENVITSKTAEFYKEHPELQYKKIILFCPTFRGANQKTAYYQYDYLDLKQIYDFCGDEYVWAFKMHPFIKNKPQIPKEYSDKIIDLTANKNINDLYYVTDIMITDYSSSYFEFALMKKPILFFTYDREMYEVIRGVQKSIAETAPGKICDSFDDLMKALKTGDFNIEKTIAFHDENFGEYDGHAADKIIDTILLSD